MNRMLRGAMIAALTIVAGVSVARAKEVKLKAAELPAAVLDSLKVHYPGAEFLGFSRETEKGATRFEADMKIKGRGVEASLDSVGVMKEEETAVTVEALPAAVRTALAHSDYAHGKVERAERHVVFGAEDTSNYEIHVKLKGKQIELLFGADGRLVSTNPADEED